MFRNRKFSLILTGALAFSVCLSEIDAKEIQTKAVPLTFETFIQIDEKATPATVFIKSTICFPQEESCPNPFDLYGDDFFQQFFRNSPFGRQQPLQPQITSGSGFFISADGYIVTNYHVIKDAKQISVILHDGREFPATIVGSDPRTDIAVLKIDGEDFPVLEFGDSDSLRRGEWVAAIGSPFALDSSITKGIVSAKGRQDLGIAALEDFIQTDAAINPGNSGGPLLNLEGKVVGVNTAIITRSGGNMGIGLAIPSKMVKHVVDQITQGGGIKRAYLGVMLQPLDKEMAEALSLGKQEGVLISDVVKGSPAEKAGLKQGDIIIAYDETPVKNLTKFRNDIAMMPPHTDITLTILRNGKTMRIRASMGVQCEGETASTEILQKFGLEIDNITPELATRFGYSPDLSGVVITKVKPGSIAAAAGLRPSFLITGVAVDWNDQQRVHNIEEFEKALKAIGDKKYVILIVKHQNYQRYYTLKIN